MVRVLAGCLVAFAFLSADAAADAGAQSLRVALYLAVVGALVLAAMVASPVVSARAKAVPLVALLLVGTLALGSGGVATALDYRIVLPILLLLVAPNLEAGFRGHDIARWLWPLLALYVTVTALMLPGAVTRGTAGLERYDVSGSVVGHAALCAIALVLAVARLAAPGRPPWDRLATGLILGAAAMMLALTGTRTGLLTLLLAAILALWATPAARRPLRIGASLAAAGLGFAVLTLAVTPTPLARLLGDDDMDYGSGRVASQLAWLGEAARHPFGLGLGAVRARLAEGRPALDGERLLEWPHSEPIRFFVEGGLPGLLLVLLLTGWLVLRALAAARLDPSPLRRGLLLALSADLIAQTLFQNYFNSIYHAAGMITVLAVAFLQAETAAARTGPVVPHATVPPAPSRGGRPSAQHAA